MNKKLQFSNISYEPSFFLFLPEYSGAASMVSFYILPSRFLVFSSSPYNLSSITSKILIKKSKFLQHPM